MSAAQRQPHTPRTIPALHRDLPGQPLSRRLDSISSVAHHRPLASERAGRCRVVTPVGVGQLLGGASRLAARGSPARPPRLQPRRCPTRLGITAPTRHGAVHGMARSHRGLTAGLVGSSRSYRPRQVAAGHARRRSPGQLLWAASPSCWPRTQPAAPDWQTLPPTRRARSACGTSTDDIPRPPPPCVEWAGGHRAAGSDLYSYRCRGRCCTEHGFDL